MTGWRLGWATGNREILASLRRVKTFFDSGSYLAIQAAGAAVLEDSERWTGLTVDRLRARREAAVPAFRSAGFELDSPKATLYLWMRVPGGESSESFCRRMLNEAHVVLLPGAALGAGGEGYVRASLTLDPELYAVACERLGRAL